MSASFSMYLSWALLSSGLVLLVVSGLGLGKFPDTLTNRTRRYCVDTSANIFSNWNFITNAKFLVVF